MKVDFFKKFDLLNPVCGLVSKITSPKGIKSMENDEIIYKLHSEPTWVYNREPAPSIKRGIYWVMNVCKVKDRLTWCHYLFIVRKDKTVFPVAEYLYCEDTSWIKQAIKVIKKFYSDEPVESIVLTSLKSNEEDEDPSNA